MQENNVMDCVLRLTRLVRRHPQHGGGGHHGHGAGRLLRLVYEHDGASAKELAEWLGIRPPSLSEMLVKLEARGFVLRERDAQDARVIRVRLTDAGKKEMKQRMELREEDRQSLNGLLTDDERAQFCALCSKMINALEQASEGAAVKKEE